MTSTSVAWDPGAGGNTTQMENDPQGAGDVQVTAALPGILSIVALNQSASGDFDSSAALTGATAAMSAKARAVSVQVSGGSIRWGNTTTTPTSTRGFLIGDGEDFSIVTGADGDDIRIIKISGDPILMIGWWK